MSKSGLDKKGLTAYGTLFKNTLGGKSTPSKAAQQTASVAAPEEERESKPLMETVTQNVEMALAAANVSGATEYMTKQMDSLKAMSSKGPMTFRVMALTGGVAMVFQCAMGSLGKLFSFSPLGALIEIYCGIFGVMTVILEAQDYAFLKSFRATLNENAKFLTKTWGRGLFYFFAGSLMFSQFNLFDMLIGGWMCFTGFTSVIVGAATANKLTDLKKSMASESFVKKLFNEMDADSSGTLDSVELAALCKSLGSPLDHNELVAALTTMDTSGDGKISYEEFYEWWAGWKHEKDELKGQFAV
jgi:hypothetical protein